MKSTHSAMEAIVRAFVDSKLTPLLVAGSILLGVFAVAVTPREEEPQITVPMMDVFVEMPGASAAEVEQRVSAPMEKKLMEIPGVEYVYTTAMPGANLSVVRFRVGEDEERSVVKLYDKLYSNFDIIPRGASKPLIKPRSIDDVPILSLTLWSDRVDHYGLRRVASELDDQLKDIPDVSQTTLIGGLRRQVRVLLDRGRMAGFHVDPTGVARALESANSELPAGSLSRDNTQILVNVGEFLTSAEAVGKLVVAAFAGRPVYLRDIASIEDGPQEPADYVFFAAGAAGRSKGLDTIAGRPLPAVTISVAKRKGANAIDVAERVLEKVEAMRGRIVPPEVRITVTRNSGETARDKSDELLKHLAIAIVSVALLIALFLGGRAAAVILVAVPVTLALTLLIYYLYGYTINRVTLFALIFSIGILVDDPIVDVENIVRHFHLPENKGRPRLDIVVEAVNEVRSPLILATFAVMFAIVPMAFVRGLMGPYMRPIPIGASTAMLFSMAIAFVVTPWAAFHLLGEGEAESEHGENALDRLYRRLMMPLLLNPWRRAAFLAGVATLFLGAVSLVAFKAVQVKMLPFDNKSEFQIVLNMPEGTPLERTAQVARELGDSLAAVPEVTDYETYVGTSMPFNFNGLVRHYYLRNKPNQADLQVNLEHRDLRRAQSHEIAKRVRPALAAIAARHGGRVQVAEVPPGPPVLETLVAEVYGPDHGRQLELARKIKGIFEKTGGVVDTDWYVEAPQPKVRLVVDKEKAALTGVTTDRVVRALAIALQGETAGLLHVASEKEDLPIVLRLPREQRSDVEDLRRLELVTSSSRTVPLAELVRAIPDAEPPYIYRKNMKRVVYVTGDVAGEVESPVYAILKLEKAIDALSLAEGYRVAQYVARQPFLTEKLAVKWDGEWQITYEVFRDMGLAFAAVMVLLYMLVVAWFQSFKTPLVILAPIPLSLIGILPAHWLIGAFFTATSMIGFIAGAGIVVRNSIILVDFVELRRQQGLTLAEAVVDAGAVRFRPMLLTASAVVAGSSVILFDPIFQGLALSLVAGEVASTLLSRIAVPVLYYLSESSSEPRR